MELRPKEIQKPQMPVHADTSFTYTIYTKSCTLQSWIFHQLYALEYFVDITVENFKNSGILFKSHFFQELKNAAIFERHNITKMFPQMRHSWKTLIYTRFFHRSRNSITQVFNVLRIVYSDIFHKCVFSKKLDCEYQQSADINNLS